MSVFVTTTGNAFCLPSSSGSQEDFDLSNQASDGELRSAVNDSCRTQIPSRMITGNKKFKISFYAVWDLATLFIKCRKGYTCTCIQSYICISDCMVSWWQLANQRGISCILNFRYISGFQSKGRKEPARHEILHMQRIQSTADTGWHRFFFFIRPNYLWPWGGILHRRSWIRSRNELWESSDAIYHGTSCVTLVMPGRSWRWRYSRSPEQL